MNVADSPGSAFADTYHVPPRRLSLSASDMPVGTVTTAADLFCRPPLMPSHVVSQPTVQSPVHCSDIAPIGSYVAHVSYWRKRPWSEPALSVTLARSAAPLGTSWTRQCEKPPQHAEPGTTEPTSAAAERLAIVMLKSVSEMPAVSAPSCTATCHVVGAPTSHAVSGRKRFGGRATTSWSVAVGGRPRAA